ncbi:kelch-like protein 13 [Myxocyprinus asiaticus]|uniref:kelch-like protein 13 n=1 Tax=Myxocyprinus asiaticus TaxID=70543 RepID=UPI0022233920|nr:kelch-like protein 13 [Myxocyprinus asiaticus]
MSEEEEVQENLVGDDNRADKEGPKELQESIQESEKADDEEEECGDSFHVTSTNSGSLVPMCTSNDKSIDEDSSSKYDNNNVDGEEYSDSCPISANSDNLVAVLTNNDKSSDEDDDKYDDSSDNDNKNTTNVPIKSANTDSLVVVRTNNDKHSDEEEAKKHNNKDDDDDDLDEEHSDSCPVKSSNSDGLVAVCVNNYKESDEDDDDDECRGSLPVMSVSSDSLVAMFTNNDKASDEEEAEKHDNNKDDDDLDEEHPVKSANSDGLVAVCVNNYKASDEDDANRYDSSNDDEEQSNHFPVTSANSDHLVAVLTNNNTAGDEGDDDNNDDDICGSEVDPENDFNSLTLEEQQMTDCSYEQGLINQKLEEGSDEEEEDDDEDECGENCSYFEDSVDEECDMRPKKIYSDQAYPSLVFQALKEMMLCSVLTDLTLSTEDGDTFQGHSIVLAAVSSLIEQRLRKKSREDSVIYVCMGPEVHGVGLAAVVEFAYTGAITTMNEYNMAQIQTAAVSLGAPRILELCKEEEQREKQKAGIIKEDKERVSADEQMNVTLQYLRQLWAEQVGCDIELEAEGRVFHAHRVLLVACCDYFRGMFSSGMRESQQESVSLLLVRAAEFEALLHCAYSGVLALGWSCIFELTCTSLQLQFQFALSLCLIFLQKEMDAYSCLDVASFAEAYGMTNLLALAEDFVSRHFQEVSLTPKFQDLPKEKLKKYLQSDSLCVPSELPVFKAVMSWIEAFPRQRVKLAKELMETIQFPLMTFKEFKEVKSITSWPKTCSKNLYESLLEQFCSNSSDVQHNFRAYLPKDTLVLVGGERITANFEKHKPCTEMWFSNSFQNHVGLVKKVEWRMLGNLPENPRFSHGVGVMKGKMYVVGGRHYYGKADTMKCAYRYDPIQNSWQRLADMHERRGSVTLVVLNEKIYAIGGERDSEVSMETVEVYCPNTNSWRFVCPLDQPLCFHAASVWKGAIFISGGLNSQCQCLLSMILYHPEKGSTYLAEMNHNRAQHCMETLGDHLYVAGGVSCGAGGHWIDQLACEVYDPMANSWSAIMSLPMPHVGSASVVLEGKVYVIGGYCQEYYRDTKSVHRYDPATERWENMGVTPGPNIYIAACVLHVPSHLRQ